MSMDPNKELEEKLRESSCTGDMERLQQLLESGHVDVNSQNPMNGWTALHWACKRNHVAVVKYLLSKGANRHAENNSKEVPAQLTNTEEIRNILQFEGGGTPKPELPIIPSYLQHPVFPYGADKERPVEDRQFQQFNQQAYQGTSPPSVNTDENELVLKGRIAYTDERDFIEVELARTQLTYDALLTLLTRELGVQRQLVYKIRKLPNTILRKDKDIARLQDFQEVELVLTNKAPGSNRVSGDISDGYKHEQILY